MGTGESGRYYTSHGSRFVHHNALIHSFDGSYSHNTQTKAPQKLLSGGHGQTAIDIMNQNGIEYHIVKTFPNGVRVGIVPNAKQKPKRAETGMAWFPRTGTSKDVVRAAEHTIQLKHNRKIRDGDIAWGTYKGVRVGVIRTHGNIATIFPDSRYQPTPKRSKQ